MLTVANFHNKFGFDVGDKPQLLTPDLSLERAEKMAEELDEFRQAYTANDLAGAADALVDLCVFLKGTAVMMGLPWDLLWDDVMICNMSKERGTAPNRPEHKQDLIKPDGWQGPQTQAILDEYL